MRIQSPFKDYYDYMQKYLTGDCPVWNRNWCIMKGDCRLIRQSRFGHMEHILIGFCGRIYGIVKADYYKTIYKPRWNQIFTHSSIHIDTSEVYKEQKTKTKKKDIWVKRLYDQYFSMIEDDKLFILNNCPIFIVTSSYAICCPIIPSNYTGIDFSLKQYRFDEIVPAEQAYNDLINYINFLGAEHKEVPQISNSDMIESHGFDSNSFRTRDV